MTGRIDSIIALQYLKGQGEVDTVKNRQTDPMRETIIEQDVTILLYFLEEFLLARR